MWNCTGFLLFEYILGTHFVMSHLSDKVQAISCALEAVEILIDRSHHERERLTHTIEPHVRAAEVRVIITFDKGRQQIKKEYERLQFSCLGDSEDTTLERLTQLLVNFQAKLCEFKLNEYSSAGYVELSVAQYNALDSLGARTIHDTINILTKLYQHMLQPIPITRQIETDFQEIYWPKCEDGSQYRGQTKEGQKHGYGSARYCNGDRYDGEWQNNGKNGLGVYTYATGAKFEGEWLRDKKNGFGIYVWPNNDRYEGGWLDQKRHGYGIQTLANGLKYEGNWNEDRPHGHGTEIQSNGDKYEGEWANETYNGFGVKIWGKGDKYEGDWTNAKFNGYGTMTWANGERYAGQWMNNKEHGFGEKIWSSGEKYKGNWENGKRHGHGTYTDAEGIIQEGDWKHDVFENKDPSPTNPHRLGISNFLGKVLR